MKKTLIVIPDIKGNYRVLRNNLRILAGKALITYVLEAAQACNASRPMDLVVASNDEAVIHLCNTCGVTVLPSRMLAQSFHAQITLDPIVIDVVEAFERERGIRYDTIMTLQITSPLIHPQTILDALKLYEASDYDTMISAVNQPGLAWQHQGDGFSPLYTERKNRSALPDYLMETGTFLICDRINLDRGSRIGRQVYVYQLSRSEGLEIIHEHDWLIAEKELARKTILIRLDGYKKIGMGHIYRGLLLADLLFEHHVYFVISDQSTLAKEKIEEQGYPLFVLQENAQILDLINRTGADIVINDILNTDAAYMKVLAGSGVRVINLEDLGDGAVYADAVINDLYEPQNDLSNFYWGSRYYCLRQEYFQAKRNTQTQPFVREILVTFGGSDPSHLTEKVIEALLKLNSQAICNVTVILGAGIENTQEILQLVQEAPPNLSFSVLQDVSSLCPYMEKADLAIASQGRTMYELAYMMVPTILMAQNERELTHAFGYLGNGFINLGLGSAIDVYTIRETVQWLMNCPQIRRQIRQCMAGMDLQNGANRVKKIILGE